MDTAGRRLARSQEVLLAVLALPDEEREAAVARLCADEPGLADEVRSLLVHAGRLGDFLDRPALGNDFVMLPAGAALAPGEVEARDEYVGSAVGVYTIERRIASGGMGTVYLARRNDDQFTRRVALKIVKRGMDSEEILERFRRERETLAGLEHPNVARLLDGGMTRTGQPYIVMEYVEGSPIDAWCDERRLTVEQRLELFLVVCAAVKYAHQHLVVHRDLKPGNVLVSADGVPKLLDFGIATVLDPHEARESTAAGERRLTPEYASPEQVAGLPVSTASDVYSLGVILFELLSGRRPYEFARRSPADVQRVVLTAHPAAPSRALLGAPAPAAAAAASRRRLAPAQLARRLRGDLDTIVLAALAKEPERRYASVEGLAADLRRHMERQPVSARRDTLRYRLTRFVQRNRVATGLAAGVVLALVAGVAAVAWQARVAARERDAALLARHEAEALTRFWRDMIESASPLRSGRELTVRALLDSAAARTGELLAEQPLVHARLQHSLGVTYHQLGAYSEAEAHLRSALAGLRAALGPAHPEVALALKDLANERIATQALDEAAGLLEEAVAIQSAASGARSLDTALLHNNLGAVRYAQRRFEEALALYEEALAIRRELGAEPLDLAQSQNNIGAVLVLLGRLAEARPLYEEALRIRRDHLEPRHPLLAKTLVNLGDLHARLGELDEAERLLAEGVARHVDALGADHPEPAISRHILARLLAARGDHANAERELRLALALHEKGLPAEDVRTMSMRVDLVQTLRAQGRDADADALVAAALEATAHLAEDSEPRVLLRAAARPGGEGSL